MATMTTIPTSGSDMLHIALITDTRGTLLNGCAFARKTQNYWVARITPPDGDQRRDAYRAPRAFQRRYLQVVQGALRIQYDVKDFSYGFAYEFGGDTVTNDRRIPARIYCVYLGTNGTGTVADFRIYPSAEMAMEAEQYMAGHPNMAMAYNPSMKLDRPAPAPAPAPATPALMPLPYTLSGRMSVLYEEMACVGNMIAVLERHLKEAGYAPLDATAANYSDLFQDAIKRGRDLGEKTWNEKFLWVVQAEAVRMGEEAKARQQAQEAPVPAAAPVAQPVVASPAAPQDKPGMSLLDQVIEAHDDELHMATADPTPAPLAPVNRLTQESDVLAAQATRAITTKSAMRPAPAKPAKPARKVTTAVPGSFPRPSSIPAPAGDDLPF